MLDVSEATKALLKTDSVYKEMYVMIENSGSPYIFENEDIYYEAFELKESILDGSDMTFMGCIASEMRITIRNRDNLKDYALNNRKITVEMTPYDRENTKNHLQSLYSAGDELEFNNVKMVVGDDLSLALTRSANADTIINVCDFMVDEDATWVLSGCPSGSAVSNRLYGKMTVTNPTTGVQTVYNDMGSDVNVTVRKGNIVQYEIIIASGQSTGVTFYPMLRDVGESSTYEPYGNKYIEMDTIPLFTGYIDNGEYDKDKSWLKLTAYDVLSKLNTFNVWNWYNKVAFTQAAGADNKGQIALDDLLYSFVTYVNNYSGYDLSINYDRCPIILSDVKIKKRLKNKEMTATNFLKAFCQLACACAIINREGELQLIYFNAEETAIDTIPYYRVHTAKDYVVRPFNEGITIRTNSEDDGVTLTSPTTVTVDWDDDSGDTYIVDDDDEVITTGNYFIDSNGLVTKLSATKRRAIIDILLNNVQTSYYAFKSYNLECNGLPYVECGDDILFEGTPVTEHHEDEFTSGNNGRLDVDNTGGTEAPFTATITFTDYWYPGQTYQGTFVSVGCGMIPTTGAPYLGVELSACMSVVGKSSPVVGDKIVLYKYNGTTSLIYKSLEDGEYVDYDVSSCTYSGFTCDMYIIRNEPNQVFTSMANGPFSVSVVGEFDLMRSPQRFQVHVVNRTLKGIQAMMDTFSFELPDTFQKFGGTTSGERNTNISNDKNTTSAQLTGEEVMIVVSFDSQTGILETTSKVV